VLANQLFKLFPCWCALILLEEREPLRRVARHVEGHQEHLPGILSILNSDELAALVELGERIIHAVVC
jgi:hypothetical protein